MAKRKSTKLSDAEAYELFEEVKAAPAVLTREQVHEIEEAVERRGWIRRLAHMTLTKPGAEILDKIKQDREFAVAYVCWFDNVKGYMTMLDDLKETVEAASLWLAVAYAQREDMDAVFEEGRAQARAA